MSRTVVVTGAASGIGAATAESLRSRGIRVITCDLHDADVIADLTTRDGRAALIEGVATRSRGAIDAIIANAGGGAAKTSVQLNFFGAVATLEGLRPLLAGSEAPRAVAVSSIGALFASNAGLVEACLGGDEPAAVAIARTAQNELEAAGADTSLIREYIYGNAKLALNKWCRSVATRPDWAGAGININIVALGLYDTPAARFVLDNKERRGLLEDMTPLRGAFPGRPVDAAALLAWLASPENTQLTGQVMFADGGFECSVRAAAGRLSETDKVLSISDLVGARSGG